MSQKIESIYQGVMTVIDESMQLLDDTKMPDTVAMKKDVERLCKAINELPISARVTYEGQLGELFQKLTTLEEKLQQKKTEVSAMLADTPIHKSASKAYSKAELSDNKSKNKPASV